MCILSVLVCILSVLVCVAVPIVASVVVVCLVVSQNSTKYILLGICVGTWRYLFLLLLCWTPWFFPTPWIFPTHQCLSPYSWRCGGRGRGGSGGDLLAGGRKYTMRLFLSCAGSTCSKASSVHLRIIPPTRFFGWCASGLSLRRVLRGLRGWPREPGTSGSSLRHVLRGLRGWPKEPGRP